ncbi:MAG: DMT family transporter [Bacteroidota bacterium]|nr:DMT family transporter [Bacteroidota bacterium]
MASFKYYLELHFIVFVWGFTAILGKLISIPAVELVFLRTLIAAAVLAIIIKYTGKSFRIGRGPIIRIIGVGMLISAHWMLFFASARVSSVSICLAGMATSSLWTAILEPIFYQKKIKPHEIGLALLIFFGLYLIFQFEFNHALGIIMGVGSAMLGATFSIINSRLTRKYSPLNITCYEMAGACLGTALFMPIYQLFLTPNHALNFSLTFMDWVYILTLALVCTVYPFTGSVRLMQRIPIFNMNLSINLEPVYGIVFAYFIFGDSEHMSGGFYLGALIILFSVFIHPILDRRYESRQLQSTLPNGIGGAGHS